MKKTAYFLLILFFPFLLIAQPCIPLALSQPGLSPDPDNIPCIERGVYYEQIIQTQSFDSIVLNTSIIGPSVIYIKYTRIDSLENFPCGISWETNRFNNTYGPGESGCIRIFGTSTDLVGQYPLDIYMSMWVQMPAAGFSDTISGKIEDLYQQLYDLAAQLGTTLPFTLPDADYHSRVIEPGNNCPGRDTSANAVNLVSSGSICPNMLVSISGNPDLCVGSTLSADDIGAISPVSYQWSSGATTQSITANTAGTYSVTVIASNGSATNSVTVGAPPTAGFTANPSGSIVIVTDGSMGGTTVTYDYGDGSALTNATSHTYSQNGSYTITQSVTNDCGSDMVTQAVLIQAICPSTIPTGNPGVTPSPDNIGCIERGVFYEQIMHLENFDVINTGSISMNVNFTRIDSLVNFPCGIMWETDRANNTYGPGEAGCIRVYGTTRDLPGQYPLEIYITMELYIPVLGTQLFSGEVRDLYSQLEDLMNQLGTPLPFTLPDIDYYSRVIEPGNACPPRDTSASAVNLVSSGGVCPPFVITIDGNPNLCIGSTLTASTYDATPPINYFWNTGANTPSISAINAGTYSVTVTAGNGTATKSINIMPLPTAGFTASVSGMNVTLVNSSSGATSISYDYGDGTGATNTTSHTYFQSGTYTITQTVTNNCGSATHTETISFGTPWTVTPTSENHTILIDPASFVSNLNGVSISNGDYIGAFYNDNGTLKPAGYEQWNGSTLGFPVYGNDATPPVKNGFNLGETFTWKVWQASTQTEIDVSATYMPVGSFSGFITDTDAFAIDGSSGLLSISSCSTQEINIDAGWNMVSSYIVPNNPNMLQVINNISSDILLIKNGSGQTTIPLLGINGIGNWDVTAGYKIKASNATILSMGCQLADPATTPISLGPGWSIISYLRTNPMNIINALSSITGNILLVKNGVGEVYLPLFGVNNIGNMLPGQGYKVKTNAPATLTYPANN